MRAPVLCCLAAALALAGCRDRVPTSGALASTGDRAWDRLIRVSDADTVVIRYHELPLAVRLVGVDAPESAHPDPARNSEEGVAAAGWARNRLAGRNLRVELVMAGDMIKTDPYHRALGWLWVEGPGGTEELFNEQLIEHGWSRFQDIDGDALRYRERLRAAEGVARAAKRGMWR